MTNSHPHCLTQIYLISILKKILFHTYIFRASNSKCDLKVTKILPFKIKLLSNFSILKNTGQSWANNFFSLHHRQHL